MRNKNLKKNNGRHKNKKQETKRANEKRGIKIET